MRSRFRRAADRVFRVDLTVHRLESIPIIHRLLYIHWRARRAIPADGRIPSKPVEKGNVITWETNISFTISIPSDPSDPTVLQPSPLTMHLRSERRTRWVGSSYTEEGSFDIDLSEIAAVGYLQRSDIFHGSLLNMILRTSIRVTHISGDKIFRTRTLPQITQPTILKTSTPSASGSTPQTSTSDSITALLPDETRHSTDRPSTQNPRPLQSVSVPTLPIPSSSNILVDASSTSLFLEPDTFDRANTPNSVLMNSIPNPEIAQRDVFEQVFQQRMRDSWPDHVINSRVDAAKVVDAVYASVCAADGIGVPTRVRRAMEPKIANDPVDDVDTPQAGPVTQMLLTRKPSGRSPHLSVRSSSMGEISEKRLRRNSFDA